MAHRRLFETQRDIRWRSNPYLCNPKQFMKASNSRAPHPIKSDGSVEPDEYREREKKARKLYPIVELAGRLGWTKKIRADA